METLKVTGANALAELDRLRRETAKTGLYPILFGDADDFTTATEFESDELDPKALIKQSQGIDVGRWLATKADEHADLLQSEDGEWPTETFDEMGIVTHVDILSRKPHQEVLIGLLQLDAAWQAFAHLGWGGWNDCPFPADHCALHRYWQQQWGAEVVSITGSVVQCIVSRPPQDREAALRLAREQHIYCSDIVEQGTGSIAALAAGLVNSNYWYFWWD